MSMTETDTLMQKEILLGNTQHLLEQNFQIDMLLFGL
jgi:hypothetical protein